MTTAAIVRHAVGAEEAIDTVQAVLELSSMAAPKINLKLRLKNFAVHSEGMQQNAQTSQDRQPLPSPTSTVVEGPPNCMTTKYDLEPLPDDVTPEERFYTGNRSVCLCADCLRQSGGANIICCSNAGCTYAIPAAKPQLPESQRHRRWLHCSAVQLPHQRSCRSMFMQC